MEQHLGSIALKPHAVVQAANQGSQGELFGVTGMDFWSLVLISAVEILCGLIFAFCRMLYFAHKDDTKFGASATARTIVVMGMFMWVIPILWMPLDVLLSLHSATARDVNLYAVVIIQSLQMVYLWVICPIILAFYETETTDTFCNRLWQALRVQLPLFLFLLIATIPTYFLLNETNIPAD